MSILTYLQVKEKLKTGNSEEMNRIKILILYLLPDTKTARFMRQAFVRAFCVRF